MIRNKRLIVIFSVLIVLVVLVVVTSAVFSVQHVVGHCMNGDASVAEIDKLEASVATSAGIKKGKSIFTLSKDDVTKRVEESVLEVRVINIEKKFPNRVYINFVKEYEYFAVVDGANEGIAYLRADGKVTEKKESQHIKLKLKGTFQNVDGRFSSTEESDVTRFDVLAKAIEQLGERNQIMTHYFRSIDLSGDYIIFEMGGYAPGRENITMTMELRSIDRAYEKLDLGMEVFDKMVINHHEYGGKIILSTRSDGRIQADHTKS